jgi:hypothetical protein
MTKTDDRRRTRLRPRATPWQATDQASPKGYALASDGGQMAVENIYIKLTNEFNLGRLRTVICSGQAAVLHRVAIMSKDGDWILREDQEACQHVLAVLERHGARYRFGAPLDIRWLAKGWSSHFEFNVEALRVRTDFFSRPPRISDTDREALWKEPPEKQPPCVNLIQLVRMKQTDREKDYVVIGELARRMTDPADQMRYSRSALDLMRLAVKYPLLVEQLRRERSVLSIVKEGRDLLEAALDAERRGMIHANEKRLAQYEEASRRWQAQWPNIIRQTEGLPLSQAHAIIIKTAETFLPMSLP